MRAIFLCCVALVPAQAAHVEAQAVTSAPLAIVDVPFISQSELLCGGAAAAMVLRYWGERQVSAEAFVHLVDRSAAGIRTGALVADLRRRGWSAHGVEGDETAVRMELARGRPVLMLIEDRPSAFHYVVTVAWHPRAVIFHDPARGPFRVMSTAEFARRWRAARRWMAVVAPGAAGIRNAGSGIRTFDVRGSDLGSRIPDPGSRVEPFLRTGNSRRRAARAVRRPRGRRSRVGDCPPLHWRHARARGRPCAAAALAGGGGSGVSRPRGRSRRYVRLEGAGHEPFRAGRPARRARRVEPDWRAARRPGPDRWPRPHAASRRRAAYRRGERRSAHSATVRARQAAARGSSLRVVHAARVRACHVRAGGSARRGRRTAGRAARPNSVCRHRTCGGGDARSAADERRAGRRRRGDIGRLALLAASAARRCRCAGAGAVGRPLAHRRVFGATAVHNARCRRRARRRPPRALRLGNGAPALEPSGGRRRVGGAGPSRRLRRTGPMPATDG
ncbi:MAG: C39 family peptidase [Acidobacteria bacterium]|nr:C39 family peptidase [Acidobacteriota bacterium]